MSDLLAVLGRIAAALERMAPPARAPGEKARLRETIYERVVGYLLETDNRPASLREIRTALGVDRGRVAVVVYNTHPGDFVRSTAKGLRHFRLAEGVFVKKYREREAAP